MTAETYTFLDSELESPLFNAPGLINGTETRGILRDVEELSGTAIGGITVGSITVPFQGGNAVVYGEPTYHYDPNTGLMVNSMGLPNVGIETASTLVDEIHDIAGDKPVIFSVSPTLPNSEIGGPVEQSRELLRRFFDAGARIVELNVSCPNVVTDDGGRKPILGHDFESMAAIADMIVDEFDEEDIFIGVKMPPYRSVSEIEVQRNIGRVLNDGVIDYIATSNTIPGGQPVNEHGENILTVPNGIGGMSGPATKTEGRAQLSSWKSLVMDNILVLGCTPVPIMSTLGIYNGEEMQVRRMLGADVVSMNTRLWNSTNWKATVSEILAEFAEFES